MTTTTSRARKRDAAPAPPAPPADSPPPLRHPAMIVAALVAAVCVVISASYVLYDTDLWSLLAGGKAIWTQRAIPAVDLWTWRHFGEPMMLSSWLYRAILWPVWSAGGVVGLYVLRWATVLAVFALLWKHSRLMGARGLIALLVMVWAALVYRQRTDLRPETFAALLFALELWILEAHRRSGGNRVWWIVPIACVWANVHISYSLAFVLIGVYAADAAWGAPRSGTRPAPRRLLLVALGAAGAALVNPFGARLLLQPFEFALAWRHDPMFQTIAELHPLVWSANLRNGLPLMMLLWPVLWLWRSRRRGVDVAEGLCAVFFTTIALASWRFVGIYALAAAPFVARDLEEFVAARRWRVVPRREWVAAGAFAVAALAISLPEWTRPALTLGIGIERATYPEHACDFIAERGVRGRGFNESQFGGYQAFRFSPDAERLPFIGTQPEYAAPEDRRLYIASYTDPAAWRELEARHRFDYLLLPREQVTGNQLLDFVDRDSNWIMVFTDDVAEVLVRRDGRLADVARRFGYRALPAGLALREQLLPLCAASPELRAAAIAELERAAASSPLNGSAHHLLGFLALIEQRPADAVRHLERAIRLKPALPHVRELLGRLAVQEGQAPDSLAERSRQP